ncbi:hypothetical protein [Gracilimonas sp.]|uniref:hypothetical protein n=1 Tax=Gracilimonas sp. TaxID=1974203 RepID=UPI002871CEF8|nr:hypothetical protein [Gracilimonas sp.]
MKKSIFFTLILFLSLSLNQSFAQFGEPEVQERDNPRNLFDEGYKTGFGFNFLLSDFGFGAGGQFRIGLNPYTEAIINLKISALKDPSEQTFTDFLGYRTIPEKYKRVISIPLYIGLKKRFFAEAISDNFRAFSSLSVGPTFAFSYDYFNDFNENGFRENDARIYGGTERVNDIFTGWGNGDTHWGLGGELVIGVDFGDNFANLSTVQFGYTMNYFPDGIQVLEPCQPDLNRLNQTPNDPCSLGPNIVPVGGGDQFAPLENAHDPRKYFGSAQINFIFGWMW